MASRSGKHRSVIQGTDSKLQTCQQLKRGGGGGAYTAMEKRPHAVSMSQTRKKSQYSDGRIDKMCIKM